MFSWRNVQEDPINTYRPFYGKFQNGHIFGKSPYYRPWFFDVLRGFQKSQILTERPYYRPCFLGEMFKRTQLTLTDPFMGNFKMATFWKKPYVFGGGAIIRMVTSTIASFLEIIAKDFRNSAHGMSCA